MSFSWYSMYTRPANIFILISVDILITGMNITMYESHCCYLLCACYYYRAGGARHYRYYWLVVHYHCHSHKVL